MLRAGQVFAATVFLGLASAGAARADLIVNGSFESPVVSSYAVFANGGVPGWTSNNNEQEINNTSGLSIAPYAGVQSTELNGNTFDTISQTVTGLTVGQRYVLTWAYAGRDGSGNQQMNVLFGGTQVGQNTSSGATAWSANSVIVQATAVSQVVSFAAINVGGNSSIGNELDAVTLNALVPEPGTVALFATALIGFVWWRQKRAA